MYGIGGLVFKYSIIHYLAKNIFVLYKIGVGKFGSCDGVIGLLKVIKIVCLNKIRIGNFLNASIAYKKYLTNIIYMIFLSYYSNVLYKFSINNLFELHKL